MKTSDFPGTCAFTVVHELDYGPWCRIPLDPYEGGVFAVTAPYQLEAAQKLKEAGFVQVMECENHGEDRMVTLWFKAHPDTKFNILAAAPKKGVRVKTKTAKKAVKKTAKKSSKKTAKK